MKTVSKLKWPLGVTLWSIFISLVVTYLLMSVLLGRNNVIGYVIAFIVPATIAFPITYYIQRQRIQLDIMHEELKQAHRELEHIAQFDDLTQIYNRATFYRLSNASAVRGEEAALLMVDVDHFKRINDQYGHKAGDEALRLIVEAIKSAVREGDFVGRMGGEEFCIYCPQASRQQAPEIAERIRKAVMDLHFEPHEGVTHPLTVSIGGVLADPVGNLDKLIQTADRYMYEAKQTGRNKVAFATLQ